jgi:hypothetical protein
VIAPPGNDQRRPVLGTGVEKVIAARDLTSVTQTGDLEREVVQYLAGLRDGDRLGRAAGFDEGFAAGADDAYERVQSVLTGCTSTWSSPSQEELRKLRNDPPITRPCSQRCRWRLVCRRYAQWWRETRPDLAVAQ